MSDDIADLSATVPLMTAVLHTVVPGTNKRTGWDITFAGPAHEKTITYNEAVARRDIDKQTRIEMAQVNGRKWKGDDKQPEDRKRENVDWIVARIVDWTPVRFGQISPEPIAFSEKNATDLLMRPDMGLYFAQMVDFLAAEASFIERSAKT